MGDAENALPPSKKRAAGREISRDTPFDDEEDTPELETGTFKRASDEVLAGRRIVKVRRQQTNSAPSTNPFAGIRLVSPTESSANPPPEATHKAQPADDNTVADDTKGGYSIIKDSEKAEEGNNNKSESKTDEMGDKSAAYEDAVKESAVDKEHPAEERVDEKSQVDKEQGKDGDKNENEDKKDAANKENDGEVDKEQTKDDNNTGNDDEKEKDAANKDSAGEVDKEQTRDDNNTGNDKKENTDNEDKKDNEAQSEEPSAEGSALKSFQQLSSSQNAFTGLAGTGFSASSLSFGSLSKDGSASGTGSGSIFGMKTDKPFGLGLSNNGNSVFGATGASSASKGEGSGFSTMQEVVVETGEENEKMAFNADSVLFEFVDGSWKERGKGELRINVTTGETEKARLLMRSRGNYRLILNARLYPDMKLTNMDKKGVTFACINSATEGKDGLSTFALKFKDGSIVEEFKAAVMAHKGEKTTVLKTPENSPKASGD